MQINVNHLVIPRAIGWLSLTAVLVFAGTAFGQVPEPQIAAPLPDVVDRVTPASATETTPGHLFIDFGQDSFAGLEITVPNPQPGQQLTVTLGEKLSAPQAINSNPGGSVRCLTSTITLAADKKTYVVPLTPADQRRVSAEVGAVMPFRYVEIDGAPPGLDKSNIVQLVAHYPFDDNAAHFDSSDPKLNAVWNLCHHTVKATSFAAIFIDGDRERLPYEADAYFGQLGWYYATPDTTLPRISWEYLIDHPTWPTEWILFSVLMAWNDYQYTGDTTGLAQFYTDLQAKTLIALEREDGLISTSEPPVPKEVKQAIHGRSLRDIVDWPAHDRDGYELKPVNTVVNAFHAVALQRMAQIARALNHPDDATRYEAAAKKTIDSLNAKLFDPATGLYVDGEGSTHSSAHANFFPLAFGLVPPDRQQKIADYLAGRGMPCSVYGAQFLMEALFDHGHADAGLALITASGGRSWTHMLDNGLTMTCEAWDDKDKRNQDWNHIWGAAPANIIPRKLMGIEPLEPGYAKILIQPRPTSLKWAELRVPTVKGSLFVRFDNEPKYQLTVEIPAKTTARIGIPVLAPDGPISVQLDGKPAQANVAANTAFLDAVSPGRHIITAPANR